MKDGRKPEKRRLIGDRDDILIASREFTTYSVCICITYKYTWKMSIISLALLIMSSARTYDNNSVFDSITAQFSV